MAEKEGNTYRLSFSDTHFGYEIYRDGVLFEEASAPSVVEIPISGSSHIKVRAMQYVGGTVRFSRVIFDHEVTEDECGRTIRVPDVNKV